MIKISIVLDTNVLLTRLDLVKELYACSLNACYTINFAKTVLNELDGLKKKNVQARNAITFIESVANLIRTEIEGKIDDRKMDIVVDERNPIVPNNNDDKILNYCFQLENPIFLTSDKAFILKCDSFNIKSIKVDNKNLNTIIKEIHKAFGLNSPKKQQEAKDAIIERMIHAIKETIEPVFIEILARELGPNYGVILDRNNAMDFYCDLIINNFCLFEDFLPHKSPKIFKEFKECVRCKNLPRLRQLAPIICLLFRRNMPDNIL